MFRAVTASSSLPVVIISCASCLVTARVSVDLVIVIAVGASTCSLFVTSEASSPFWFCWCCFPIVPSVPKAFVSLLLVLCCTNVVVSLVADFSVDAYVRNTYVL